MEIVNVLEILVLLERTVRDRALGCFWLMCWLIDRLYSIVCLKFFYCTGCDQKFTTAWIQLWIPYSTGALSDPTREAHSNMKHLLLVQFTFLCTSKTRE